MRHQRENAPKFQNPKPKPQRNSKLQVPKSASEPPRWCSRLGASLGFGTWNLWLSSAPARRRPDWFTDGQRVSTSSKKANARGSFDWPSQNIASLRTSRFRLARATWTSLGEPSSLGSWLNANTAFFFTSVSGSFSIASEIALAALSPAFCASQNNA